MTWDAYDEVTSNSKEGSANCGPQAEIGPTLCFHAACKPSLVFTFLYDWKRVKRKVPFHNMCKLYAIQISAPINKVFLEHSRPHPCHYCLRRLLSSQSSGAEPLQQDCGLQGWKSGSLHFYTKFAVSCFRPERKRLENNVRNCDVVMYKKYIFGFHPLRRAPQILGIF